MYNTTIMIFRLSLILIFYLPTGAHPGYLLPPLYSEQIKVENLISASSRLKAVVDSLQNHLLIAMPHLTDPSFNRAVIYICDYSPQGALGLVINRPMSSAKVEMILETLGIEMSIATNSLPDVYYGGPVQPGQGFVLHSPEYKVEDTSQLSGEFALSTNIEVLKDISRGNGPEQYRLSMGYAGWGEGQLDREIANGDWLLVPADAEFVFQKPDTVKWAQAAKRFGIEISDFSGPGGMA